jgi:integrase
MANRVAAVLSKMFALAIKWEMRADNPVIGIERAPEHRRERFMSPEEIARLSDVLATHPEKDSANAVRLLLLTGARRGEVLSASWSQFDLNLGIWSKPAASTKQKKEHRIPLSAPALLLLTQMKTKADRENERRTSNRLPPEWFLFPGKEGNHQTDIRNSGHRSAGRRASEVFVSMIYVTRMRRSWRASATLSRSSADCWGILRWRQRRDMLNLMDDPLRSAAERVGAIISGVGRVTAAEVPTERRG